MAFAIPEVMALGYAYANSTGKGHIVTNAVRGGKKKIVQRAKLDIRTNQSVTLVQEDTTVNTVTCAQKDGSHGNTLPFCFQTPYQKMIFDICVTNASQIIGDTIARNVQWEMMCP